MQQHPVPQNIIDVEFKLFGSFTLKQFGKILIGFLLALGFFLINIPVLIKIPLCIISGSLGLGLAIVPNLGIWLNGFFKAIFFSPRYVWVKQEVTPDILKGNVKKEISKNQKVSASRAKNKLDITDLPLDKLFGTKAGSKLEENTDEIIDNNPARENNFVRVYDDVFGKDVFKQEPINSINDNMGIKSLNNNSKTVVNDKKYYPKTAQEYTDEIKKLKFELSLLAKDENYKAREEQIISSINELYTEIKALNSNSQMSNPTAQDAKNLVQQQNALSNSTGRIVFGIVVDKKDNPIFDVSISFINASTQMIYRTKSSQNGKFTSQTPLPTGSYSITLADRIHKFHTYMIDIKDQKLPAYKFREK